MEHYHQYNLIAPLQIGCQVLLSSFAHSWQKLVVLLQNMAAAENTNWVDYFLLDQIWECAVCWKNKLDIKCPAAHLPQEIDRTQKCW